MTDSLIDSKLSPRLKTRQLTLLMHLNDQRSILGAARAANMTQPAASKLLTELEDALGVPLFERHSRGVEPTLYGDVLLRHARNALTEIHKAQQEIADLKAGLIGHASIGTVVTSATKLVPMAVAKLKARSPRLLINIEMDFSEVLVRQLIEGKFDIVVARIYKHEQLVDLNFEPFGEEAHAMYAGANHPLALKRSLSLKDLAEQSWVLPPRGNVLRERLSVLFVEQRMELPRKIVETASLPIIISLLQMSEMISALPSEVVRPYCESGALKQLPINLDLRLGEAGIITRRNQELSPAAKAMKDELKAAIAQLYIPRKASHRLAKSLIDS